MIKLNNNWHFLALALTLGGCSAGDAIKATTQMPDEMHKMQEKMDTTNSQVAQTNGGMATTNAGIHNQTLMLALDGLQKPENAQYLDTPVRMLPYGEKFAKEATAEELAKLSYVWLKEIQDLGDLGMPAEQLAKLDMQKNAKLTALKVIAALTPQKTVDQMISEQIYQEGHYYSATLAFLALRATFIKAFMLDSSLLDSGKIKNIGDLLEAITRSNEIEAVVALPFAADIKVSATGFANDDLDFEVGVDADMVKDSWDRIQKAASSMSARYNGQASVQPGAALPSQENARRFSELSNLVSQKNEQWNPK